LINIQKIKVSSSMLKYDWVVVSTFLKLVVLILLAKTLLAGDWVRLDRGMAQGESEQGSVIAEGET
jgi:hypothetical protein